MLLSRRKHCENWCSERRSFVKGVNEIPPLLCTFFSNLEQIWYRCPQSHFDEFLKNWCSKSHALLRNIIEFLCYFLIYVPIRMKFGVRYLHMCSALMSAVTVSTWKAVLFLWTYVEVNSCKFHEMIWHFESNECFGKGCVPCQNSLSAVLLMKELWTHICNVENSDELRITPLLLAAKKKCTLGIFPFNWQVDYL
jgi:hypothetical protein